MLLSARTQTPDFQKARSELFEISHQKIATFEELKDLLDPLNIENLPSYGQAVSVGTVKTDTSLRKEHTTLRIRRLNYCFERRGH